jgi:hypothetical protein
VRPEWRDLFKDDRYAIAPRLGILDFALAVARAPLGMTLWEDADLRAERAAGGGSSEGTHS